MNELQTVRSASSVGAEIRALTQQFKYMTLVYGVEVGRRLIEAKELVPYGSWGDWLKGETDFSAATASRFMRLYSEYGALLDGSSEDVSTLKKVSVSNALRLLALPENEREEFAQEHDVENISARDLDKLIAERDEAIKRAADAEKSLAEEEARRAEVVAPYAEQLEILRAENKELRERPVEVAVEVDEEAVARAAAEAKSKADAEWAKKLEAAQKAKEKSEKNAEKLEAKLKLAEADAEKRCAEAVAPYEEKLSALSGSEEEIASLRKQLAMSGAEITTFRLRFDAWQQAFQQMLKSLEAVPEENRDKLHAAIKAAFDAQKSQIGGED